MGRGGTIDGDRGDRKSHDERSLNFVRGQTGADLHIIPVPPVVFPSSFRPESLRSSSTPLTLFIAQAVTPKLLMQSSPVLYVLSPSLR